MDLNAADVRTKKKYSLLQFFKRLKNINNDTIVRFTLPFNAWKVSREIFSSILLASLLINLMALVFPLTLLQIYDRIIPNQSANTLFWLTFVVFTAMIISAILQVTRSYIGAWADARFDHFVGCKAFKTLMNCCINSYEKEGSGRHLKRISALALLKNFYAGQLLVSMVDVPFVIIFLLLIAYIGLWIVLVPIVVIGAMLCLLSNNAKAMRHLLQERQEIDDRRLNFLIETISKMQTIKSSGMEASMMRRYERLQETSMLYDYQVSQRSSYLLSNSMTFSQLTIVLVVLFGGMLVFNGELTVGALAACTLLSGRCLQPINTLMTVWSRLQSVKIAHQELNKVLAMKVESNDKSEAISATKLNGKIECRNISFGYNEDTSLLFNDMNLQLAPNESISINGEQFSGKSTFCYLLMGILKPSKGSIRIDDKDIANMNLEFLRSHVAYFPENSILFKGTILENLTMFDPLLEEQAINAVTNIGLNEDIEHLPDGFDTKVGQQSSEILSRGMMQRIVMARALVRNPRIILFNESNAMLDRSSDQKLEQFIQKIIGKYTVIIISHRFSMLKLASKQYQMKDGKLRLIS